MSVSARTGSAFLSSNAAGPGECAMRVHCAEWLQDLHHGDDCLLFAVQARDDLLPSHVQEQLLFHPFSIGVMLQGGWTLVAHGRIEQSKKIRTAFC